MDFEDYDDYIDHYFRIVDGKITLSNVHNKKRGRKKGYQHDDITKSKIADRMRDRKKSPEERKKISDRLKGRKKDLETIEKISRTKRDTWPADDLLKDYTKPDRREDRDWLHKNMDPQTAEEVKQWILENAELFNEVSEGSVRTYKDLRAFSMKEHIELVEQFKDAPAEITKL
jgi:hypothetical protein